MGIIPEFYAYRFRITDNDILKHYGSAIKIKFNPPIVNAPDPQGRLFKNVPYIEWKRRLHEKVEGFKSYTFVPPQKDYAIVHEKTIEKQRQTNLNYNKMFTDDENRGYHVK